jgi:acylaminoacyl-peptidase
MNMDPSKGYASIFGLHASISSATIKPFTLEGHFSVTVTRSVRDIDEDKNHTYVENLLLTPQLEFHSMTPHGVELARNAGTDASPSGLKTIIQRTSSDEKQTVEIQTKTAFGSFILDVSNLHGNFVTDSWFGGYSWSKDERFVIYVAQKMKPKQAPTTAFNQQETARRSTTDHTCTTDDAVAAATAAGCEEPTGFEYKEDWGERYVDVTELVLVVVDTHRQSAIVVPDIDMNTWTVGQPVFIPSDKYRIVYTAWCTKPRRLGMIYCYHRPCSLFTADLTALLTHHDNHHVANVGTDLPSNGSTPPSSPRSRSSSFGSPRGLGVPLLCPRSLSVVHFNITVDRLKLARSPRCSSDGHVLVFLGNEKGFETHSGPTQMFSMFLDNWDPNGTHRNIQLVVDEVEGLIEGAQPVATAARGPFPGLFLDSLPRQCFVAHRKVVLATSWGSRDNLVIVDVMDKSVTAVVLTHANNVSNNQGIKSGAIKQLSSITATETDWNSPEECSMSILDVHEPTGLVLISISSPDMPHRVGVYNATSGQYSIHLCPNHTPSYGISKKYAGPTTVVLNLESIRWKILRFIRDDNIPIECVIILPKPLEAVLVGEALLPLIVIPHGGPHSCFSTMFDPAVTYLCLQLQSAIMLVNYRGSTGFGSASVAALPGHCGTMDLSDVMHCVQAVTHSSITPFIEASKISIVGGSHGGFLAAHAVGQHPEVFRAGVLRNPVTNIAGMVSVSDIPGGVS